MTQNIAAIDKQKQGIVTDLCALAQANPIVKKLIIFGSAAKNSCHDESDVDICFDISADTRSRAVFSLSREASKICDYHCDVFFYSLLGSKMKSEIDRTGVVVYES